MTKEWGFRLILLFFALCMMSYANAQSWNFTKEKEGIKLYTRAEAGKPLKAYKGIAEIKAPAERVFALLEDVNHTEWWDKNFSQIRVILYKKNKQAQYYLVYDLPWPVADRDLWVDVSVAYDAATGAGTITAVPLPHSVPEKSGMVRITSYRQTWTVKPVNPNLTQVVLEGYLDPAGAIPEWLSNMLIVDSPVKVINQARELLENAKFVPKK